MLAARAGEAVALSVFGQEGRKIVQTKGFFVYQAASSCCMCLYPASLQCASFLLMLLASTFILLLVYPHSAP